MLFPCTMFYSNACWGPFVKCWDLSLLLSLTQTLCPNQCSRVWRGSLSPAIILRVIPSLVCLGPSKWDKSEFQIQWILMRPLRPMMTYVHVCIFVSKRRGQRGSAVDWLDLQQYKQPEETRRLYYNVTPHFLPCCYNFENVGYCA